MFYNTSTRSNSSKKLFVATLAAMLIAFSIMPISLTAGSPAAASRTPRQPTLGQPAPSFSLVTFGGQRVASETLRGQVVAINIWATWCGPCRSEMPMMHNYFQANQARGLAMFGVTTENSVRPSHPAMRRLSAALSYPLSNRMRGPYGPVAGSVPTTFVIDRAGMVRQIKIGSYTAESFRQALEPLLAEPAPPAS